MTRPRCVSEGSGLFSLTPVRVFFNDVPGKVAGTLRRAVRCIIIAQPQSQALPGTAMTRGSASAKRARY